MNGFCITCKRFVLFLCRFARFFVYYFRSESNMFIVNLCVNVDLFLGRFGIFELLLLFLSTILFYV